MKYAVLIADGMSDLPLKELGGKTPLETAKRPHMDYLTRMGTTGFARTVPPGCSPGSDICILSIFGYDPKTYYTGRAPLEAASLGITLQPEEVAYRCNLVTIKDGVMEDFSAGHIEKDEARIIMEDLNKKLGTKDVRFYPGTSYRNLLVIKKGPEKVICTPPHDISGKKIESFLPSGEGAEVLVSLMEKSIPFLKTHPLNQKRERAGKRPATQIWIWGLGKTPTLPTLREKYGLTGGVVTAVDLVKGIGIFAGLKIIKVPGATGYYDTNYLGKAEGGLAALKEGEIVFIHVEAPDEASHNGDVKAKIEAIENFDRFIVGTFLEKLPALGDFKILLMPDHPTYISTRTHSEKPVPFAIYSSKNGRDNVEEFTEGAILESRLRIEEGYRLMDLLIKGSLG